MLDDDDLARFELAQSSSYAAALNELRRGCKTSHWMWFVFPQLRGLGHSTQAHYYGLDGIEEATEYWAHPILGARLRECVAALLAVPDASAQSILGDVDALKLRSCLTLFREVAPDDPNLKQALNRFFQGNADELTLSLLRPR